MVESIKKTNNECICVCTNGFFGKQCEYSGGKDTSFMVIFQEGISSFPATPKILVASENTTRLSVRYFNENKIHTITMDKSNTEYNLSKSVLPSDGIHMAGIELHSDKGINVYGFFFGTELSEGYSSMPTRFASTKYIIPTLPAFITRYKNMIALTPCYQNTVVSINLNLKSGSVTYDSKQYSNNDTIRVMVSKYDTFQLSTTSDLSGTLVTSSKPVIVVSGNQCNFADNIRAGSCNQFIESVIPTDQLDDMFITPYISTRLNNTVRIQVINSTNLTIKTGNKTISKTINARDFFDFYYNTISFISSSDDILVTSYPHGLSGGKGDPFMMTILGVNQYLYEYDFVVPYWFDSFISITVQSDAINGFLLDGNSFNNRSSVFNISEGMNNVSTFSLPISAGYHHIEHKKKVRFGLWVYGNKYIDGYGYPAGMAYKAYN
ncbi:IgGFc-binding protein-like [Mytilus edulis]|uniref:IgGFc-binding protein-like n=1 Tax=Mytilus edulis TaxID=6550 RepID=UPI0039F0E61E